MVIIHVESADRKLKININYVFDNFPSLPYIDVCLHGVSIVMMRCIAQGMFLVISIEVNLSNKYLDMETTNYWRLFT